jgi:hypothetical protein
MTMPERTHHTNWDDTLRRILAEPSTAARLLTATADALDASPFLTATEYELDHTAGAAALKTLVGLPEVVAEEAASRAAQAFPAVRPRETCGEYALRLRAAARTV